MLQGIYFLLTLIAIAAVIRWYIQNDRLKPGEPTKGIFSMERRANQEKKASRFTRRAVSRHSGPPQP